MRLSSGVSYRWSRVGRSRRLVGRCPRIRSLLFHLFPTLRLINRLGSVIRGGCSLSCGTRRSSMPASFASITKPMSSFILASCYSKIRSRNSNVSSLRCKTRCSFGVRKIGVRGHSSSTRNCVISSRSDSTLECSCRISYRSIVTLAVLRLLDFSATSMTNTSPSLFSICTFRVSAGTTLAQ